MIRLVKSAIVCWNLLMRVCSRSSGSPRSIYTGVNQRQYCHRRVQQTLLLSRRVESKRSSTIFSTYFNSMLKSLMWPHNSLPRLFVPDFFIILYYTIIKIRFILEQSFHFNTTNRELYCQFLFWKISIVHHIT